MSEEAPVAPAVSADAGDSVAGRASDNEPKPDAPESASRPDNEAEKAPEGDEKPAESAASESAETKPAETTPPAESTDANGKEEGDAAPAEAETVEANGTRTPASAKKASARRKSTGGASTRKRKSQQRVTHLDAKPGEYYLARLKSFPPWPAIICDEEMLPQSLLNTRPVTTKQADGTYKEPYADGGKRVYERTFPIMFLETNEFAWIPNTDLTPLDPESCKNVPEKGKGKTLLAAYRVAAENHDLQYFKDLLAEHQRAVQQEAEEREAKAAAKAAAKTQKEEKKKRRKSATAAEEAEDIEMDEADHEDHEKPKSAKKRKKEAESDAEEEKPSKTPKTTTKLKLTTPKTPTAETGKKEATSAKAGKQKKAGKGDEEEAAVETPKGAPKPIDPQEAKAKKEKEILFIRHKLQKGFLSRDQAPKEEEMAAMSNYISKLETHTDLEVSIIRATKINKVLKAIIKLNSIPKDEEYQFRRRSIDILSKWKNLLESDVAAAGAEEAAKEAKPTTNGVHKEGEGAEAKKADKAEAGAQDTEEKPAKEEEKEAGEPKDEPMPDAETEEKDKEKAQAPEPAKEEEYQAADTEKPEKPEKPTEEKPAEETSA